MADSPVDRWISDLEAQTKQSALMEPVPEGSDKARFDWALEVLASFLGAEWLEAEIDPRNTSGYLLLGGPPDREEREDFPQLRLMRAEMMARYLIAVRQTKGFAAFLSSMPSRTLVDVAAELRAVTHMLAAGSDVELLSPPANGGPCPDARFVLSRQTVYVEVKAKREKWPVEYRSSMVVNSLRKARNQLPPHSPGIVYLQLPYPWGDVETILRDVDQSCRTWLSGTGRVNAVVLMLERRVPIPKGIRLILANYTIPNRACRLPLPDIQGWLDLNDPEICR